MRAGPGAPLGAGKKITGPGSSSFKYDILTALLVTAARGNAEEARLAMRLSLLVTARFNWRQESFAVGQKEMARMWGVTDRTAKREMAAMRARGWIAVAVPAARGRVAQYRIRFDAVLRDTIPHWEAVGPDFVARMSGSPEPQTLPADNVVPLRPRPAGQGGEVPAWDRAAERLSAEDPSVWGAWFAGLVPMEGENGLLTLVAPSRFVADYIRTHHMTRLTTAVILADPAYRGVEVIWGGD
ncbi:DnaA N-terminal domain-containing protein [Pseudooceanicola sp.]|uniref:DnaA N-terminal domain-containing protein n=1 Tax=Pseudooceanicola sp. TaxID=1914328 RepID=UPI0035C77AFB